MNTRTIGLVVLAAALVVSMAASDEGCDSTSSDKTQREQNEKLLAEATSQVGMPAIKNFRERKLLKDILELRDQSGLVTYTYTFSEMSGKLTFFCNSIGYGIPYATQFTNPMKPGWVSSSSTYTIPQADPNGLFSPTSADATWVMCNDPDGKETRPVLVEPRIVVSPFKLAAESR